jgi:hypothetical protein
MKLKFTTIALTLLFFILTNLLYNKVAAQAPNQNTYASYDTDKNDTITPKEYINAFRVIQTAKSQERVYDAINPDSNATFPFGISKIINGNRYVVFIDSAFYEDNAILSMYTEFVIPGTDNQLVFGIKNIAFTNENLKFTSNTRLELLRSETIKISENVYLQLAAGGKNFVEWDCNGFKAVNLEGTFKFKKGLLIPTDEDLNPSKDANATVNATFKIYATDLSNIMAGVSITPFQIKGLTDFTFEVEEATVDLSENVNPQGMQLTSIERDSYGGDDKLWKGFYLQKLKVTLPPLFSKQDGNRPSVAAEGLRIDDFGVTGTFSAENILKLGDADAGGWPISIDRVEVQLVHSKIRGGGIGGELKIGFLGDSTLRYLARVSDKDGKTWYNFSVTVQDSIKFKTFLGDLRLDKSSIITLDKINDSIVGSATLHGRFDISQKLLKAPGIEFQQLVLSTQKPYVRSGVFSVNGNINCKIAGYGLQFERLTFGISKGELALSSEVTLDLMNSGDKGFMAKAEVMIKAKQEETTYTKYIGKTPIQQTRAKWKFGRVSVSSIALDVKISAFQLKGIIRIYEDHPVYGNGFQGSLAVKIPSMPQPFLANAYFGTKADSVGSFKYYHVDVKVPMGPSGVPLFPGISLYAITGGLSYRMERPNDFDPYKVALDKDAKVYDNISVPMDSLKHEMLEPFLTYIPSRRAGYGFLAGVTIATTGVKNAINADLMFEVMLRHTGGLMYVQFDGSMYVMASFEKRGKDKPKDDKKESAIFIQAKVRYDNDNHTLMGLCKTYVNTPGGAVEGVGENGLVGDVEFYFSKHDWWFYIGKPSNMFGVSIMDGVQARLYMQVGTKIEDMPPPPPEVGDILGETNLNFMDNENAMSTGKGFGFGVHFKMQFGIGNEPDSKSFIYAYLKAGAGVDVLMRDYGKARCKGTGELGINGWYASGQAYVYLDGRVGIRVGTKFSKKKKEFDIARIGAAVILQAKLPNPTWMRGIAGVKYSILGGIIKGNAKVKFELGSQCELISAKEINIEIIKDFLPDSNATDVSVFATPQASFNFTMDKSFEMMNNEDVVTTYRIKLDAFTLEADKKQIAGKVNFTPDNNAVNYVISNEILPPSKEITGTVSVLVEKFVPQRQISVGFGLLKKTVTTPSFWTKVLEDGAPMIERKIVVFKTGEAPNKILPENVAYTYPINKQYNFLSKETNTGYIQLKFGQAYLFEKTSGTGNNKVNWKYAAHFESNDGTVVETPLSYDVSKKTVIFNFPETMKNSMVYRMGIVKIPEDGGNAANNVQQNTTTTIEAGEDGEEGDVTTITTNTLKGMALSENAMLLYQLTFRSSNYNSFKEKIAAQRAAMDLVDINGNYQPIIGKRYDSDEAFDLHDLEGNGTNGALVQLSAAEDNDWLANKVSPLLYDPYPTFESLGLGITEHRKTAYLGVKPLKAVGVYNNTVGSFELSAGEMGESILAGKVGRIRYMYMVNYFSNLDHHEMRNKAANSYGTDNTTTAPEPVRNLMLTMFPELEARRQYKIKLNYVLPGTGIVTSTVEDAISFD